VNTLDLVELDLGELDLDGPRAAAVAPSQWSPRAGAGPVLVYAHHVHLLEALGRGEFEDAYQYAAAVTPPGELSPTVAPEVWVTLDLVEAAVRTDRRAEAAAHAAAMLDRKLATLSPRFAMLTWASVALSSEAERTPDCFAEALTFADIEQWPFDVARVQLLSGEHLRRQRATVEARINLSAAFDGFERLGAHPWMNRAATELRATGLGADGDTSPWALTAQEREIAELAACGLTNKEIARQLYLSHRTVGAHLYRVFPKLGITSRAALRDALEAAA
jgi:DNA-binding CsgD family transcriptional regulator